MTRAQRLLELFQGREDHFAEAYVMEEGGRQRVAYRPVRRALTVADVEHHCKGEAVLGVYLLRQDSTVCFCSIDLDSHEEPAALLPQAEELRQAGIALGIPEAAMMLVDSGLKGYHLHLFFEQAIAAREARRLLQIVVAKAGKAEGEGLEIFPKQDQIDPEQPDNLGNLIKLPFAVHPLSGRVATLIKPRPVQPLAAAQTTQILLANANVVPLRQRPTGAAEGGLIPEGRRNDWLTSQGGRLREDGLGAAAIEAALLEFNRSALTAPLAEEEVRAIARSVSRYPAGNPNGHQPKPKTAVEDDLLLKVQLTNPRAWYLVIPGAGEVRLTTLQLESWPLVRRQCMDQLQIRPHYTPTNWPATLDELMDERRLVKFDVPEAFTDVGRLIELINVFVNRNLGDSTESIERHGTMYDPLHGEYLFRGLDLLSFFDRYYKGVSPDFVYEVLRARLGGNSRRLRRVAGQPTRLYAIAKRALQRAVTEEEEASDEG